MCEPCDMLHTPAYTLVIVKIIWTMCYVHIGMFILYHFILLLHIAQVNYFSWFLRAVEEDLLGTVFSAIIGYREQTVHL